MKFSATIIFVCGFIQSNAAESPCGFELDSDVVENGYKVFKKSVIGPCSFEVHDNGNIEEPSRLIMPTVTADEVPQEYYSEPVPGVFLPIDIRPPIMPRALQLLWNEWTPYDMDYAQDPRVETYEGASHQVPPYVFATPVQSVRYLPPVSTYIHETIPDFDDIYDTDDQNLENALYLSPTVRVVRSRDEGYLDQLKHDAVIPNIIPTMPYPFMRSANGQIYQAPGDTGGAVTVFPGYIASKCAIPLLFSCSPETVYGRLAQNTYDSPTAPTEAPAVSGTEYRTGPDVENYAGNQVHIPTSYIIPKVE